MANKGNTSDDFDSTVPIDLSKLDPYKQAAEEDHQKTTILDKSLDDDFLNLDAELNALDAELNNVDSDLDDVLEFSENLDDGVEESALSGSGDSVEFEPEEDKDAEDLFAFDASESNIDEHMELETVDPLVESELVGPDEGNETDDMFDFDVSEVSPESETNIDEHMEPEAEDGLVEPEPVGLNEGNETDDMFDFDVSEINLESETDIDEQPQSSVVEEVHIEPEHVDFDEELEHEISEMEDHIQQDSLAEEDTDASDELISSSATSEGDNTDFDISPQLEEQVSAGFPAGKGEAHSNQIVSEQEDPVGKSSDSSQGNATDMKTKVAILAACIGLLVGLLGLWSASSANGQVDVMQQELLSMEAQLKTYKQKLATQEKGLQEAALAQKASLAKSVDPEPQPEPKVESKPVVVITPVKVVTPETPIKKEASPSIPSGWVVNVSSDRSQTLAEGMKVKLQRSGIESVVTETNIKGSVWYRIQVVGFETKEAAKTYAKIFQQEQGIEGVWVGKAQ